MGSGADLCLYWLAVSFYRLRGPCGWCMGHGLSTGTRQRSFRGVRRRGRVIHRGRGGSESERAGVVIGWRRCVFLACDVGSVGVFFVF